MIITLYAGALGSITFDQGTVRYTHGEQTQRCTGEDFLQGALDRAIVQALELRALVEAAARLRLHLRAEVVKPQQALHRATIDYVYSFGRRELRCVWIMGRNVWADGGGERYEGTFESFLKSGFPQAIAAHLGAQTVRKVTDAVSSVAHYPCLCATGAQTPSQLGSFESIDQRTHPFAPMEVSVTVGRCVVCGRGWTFECSGDSHYGYSYAVHEFVS
jgi:hypothetical protein